MKQCSAAEMRLELTSVNSLLREQILISVLFLKETSPNLNEIKKIELYFFF